MTYDDTVFKIRNVSILWGSSCPSDHPNITAYMERRGTEEHRDEEHRITMVPLLERWFKNRVPDAQSINRGIIRMLEGVFDTAEREAQPYAEVMPDLARFGVFRGSPFVELPFGLDRGFRTFKKRDDRVRWIWLDVYERFCRLDIMDDDYDGFNFEEIDLTSFTLAFDAIADGGLIIAKAMGLMTDHLPTRPIIWREDDDEYIRINLRPPQ